ncbi:MAG TPA: hypothetical protein VJG48_03425 [Candidatus Paceibacterota bacterium]
MNIPRTKEELELSGEHMAFERRKRGDDTPTSSTLERIAARTREIKAAGLSELDPPKTSIHSEDNPLGLD